MFTCLLEWNRMNKVTSFLRRSYLQKIDYMKDLVRDYKSVLVDAVKDARNSPLKSLVIGAGLGTAFLAYKTNPTERDLYNVLADKRQMMVLVPNSIHNANADEALSSRTLLIDQNRFHYIDCWLFSLVVARPYDKNVCIYSSQDQNLKPWIGRHIYENLVDVGAFGQWCFLERSLKNYDINEEEFRNMGEASS
ncbi:hypothetical protein AB6A40_003978 [Gnathostoma spinigerum]|uniref:Uncharacterized protein n=1 Tax=Gnathostoma spinigerum TaxID=75299 RepID=A0ABD6EIV0_9BILA